MRQAITTKYLGPTNHRGSRIKVTSGGGLTMTVPWDDAKDIDDNHAAAAKALAMKYEWRGSWYGGATKEGYAFVCEGTCPEWTR